MINNNIVSPKDGLNIISYLLCKIFGRIPVKIVFSSVLLQHTIHIYFIALTHCMINYLHDYLWAKVQSVPLKAFFILIFSVPTQNLVWHVYSPKKKKKIVELILSRATSKISAFIKPNQAQRKNKWYRCGFETQFKQFNVVFFLSKLLL